MRCEKIIKKKHSTRTLKIIWIGKTLWRCRWDIHESFYLIIRVEYLLLHLRRSSLSAKITFVYKEGMIQDLHFHPFKSIKKDWIGFGRSPACFYSFTLFKAYRYDVLKKAVERSRFRMVFKTLTISIIIKYKTYFTKMGMTKRNILWLPLDTVRKLTK